MIVAVQQEFGAVLGDGVHPLPPQVALLAATSMASALILPPPLTLRLRVSSVKARPVRSSRLI